uniref:Isoaspartyl peptidase/L-asparaginase n=1 Tax=Sinocyclocheilus anshuiensis TaxID=1608454 RepID=A0A671L4U7_9TELE
MKTVIVVHGGPWAIPDMLAEASVAGVKNAVQAGDVILKNGGTATDAVEKATWTLKNCNISCAGHGAVLNIDGEVELDSIIMDGETLATGAVTSVRNITNSVSLARAVMEKVSSMFAEHIGIPVANDLVTELERKDWEQSNSYPDGVKNHDTVGAVALDSLGNVACATSTGGIRNKMVGRVGDSPIIGSGGYADNRSGAVSCTGHGESILKVTLARLILFHMEQDKIPEVAKTKYMGERVKGCGGAIVVSSTGDWAASFTTPRMAWASIKEDVLHYGLNPKEDFTEVLK